MDKMRREVKEKLNYWGRMCALFSLLMATSSVHYFKPRSGGENFADFFEGFQLGIALVLLIYAIRNIMTYRKMLHDDALIKNYYVKAHDERNAAIWAKTGGTPLSTCGILIIGAGVIAGYFNITVFITLTSCGMFLLLVRKGLYLYYSRTM